MKILITTPGEGGPLTYARLLQEELAHRGISVNILSFAGVLHIPTILRHVVFFMQVMRASSKVAVLYAQDPVSTGFPTLVAARFLGKKFFVRIAGDYAWEQGRQFFGVVDDINLFQQKRYGFSVEWRRFVQKFVARHADVVITPSEYFGTLVRGWKGAVPTVIYNGIRLGLPVQQPTMSIAPNSIVSVGRLVPWKGFDVLIDTVSELPDWHLYIIGDGEDRKRLERRAKERQSGERIHFLGALSREEVRAILGVANVFVLPTTFESFSFVVVEAMDAGIPVIAGRSGSIPELVRDGIDGVLVEPDNTTEIADAIRRISQDATLREKCIANAHERVRQFSITHTADEIEKILFKIVSKKYHE